MAEVTIRFFAAAREAAGMPAESAKGATLADVIAGLNHDGPLGPVLSVATFLVNGTYRPLTDLTPLPAGATIDVLPPFAGG